jgi:streptogramin lyase
LRVKSSILLTVFTLTMAGCSHGLGSSPLPGGASSDVSATAALRPAAGLTFHAYTAGKTRGLPSSALPIDIVAGANGTLWFTDNNTPAIGEIAPGPKFREFTTGLKPGGHPYGLVLGHDGNIWFTDESGGVGRITPSGSITEYTSARLASTTPANLTVAPDGALWTIVGTGATSATPFLVRVTVDGKMSWYHIESPYIPDGSLQADNDGNLWFFASRPNHDVVLLERTTAAKLVAYPTGMITKGEPCCPNVSPNHIAIGPDGLPYFTMPYFGYITKYGQFVGTLPDKQQPAFFSVAREGISYPVYPSSIVRLRHYLWFSGSDPIGTNGAIWRLSPTGKQIAYPIPYNPTTLVATGNTTFWFTSEVQGRPPQIVEASLP